MLPNSSSDSGVMPANSRKASSDSVPCVTVPAPNSARSALGHLVRLARRLEEAEVFAVAVDHHIDRVLAEARQRRVASGLQLQHLLHAVHDALTGRHELLGAVRMGVGLLAQVHHDQARSLAQRVGFHHRITQEAHVFAGKAEHVGARHGVQAAIDRRAELAVELDLRRRQAEQAHQLVVGPDNARLQERVFVARPDRTFKLRIRHAAPHAQRALFDRAPAHHLGGHRFDRHAGSRFDQRIHANRTALGVAGP